jgi:hypothetical protein
MTKIGRKRFDVLLHAIRNELFCGQGRMSMGEVVTAQLRLRRAFRYGYFAFVAVAGTLLAMLGLWLLSGDVATALNTSLPVSTIFMIIALGLGLSVPLFFAAWLVVGSAILGNRLPPRPLMDGIQD